MGRAKDIILKPIPSNAANAFVKRYHYSGKVVQNSSLHLGAFLDGKLHGVMSYGSPLDKRKVLGLVHTSEGVPVKWNEMLELNRMAFDEYLPANSESRCISVSFRLLRKNAPHIKWILSFADGTQCGDGAIYRASGFMLTGFSSGAMWLLPEELAKINNGPIAHRMTMQCKASKLSKEILMRSNGKNLTIENLARRFGGEIMGGYMLRYIYLIDKTCHLTVPVVPFSKIDEMGAGMYKGEKVALINRKTRV